MAWKEITGSKNGAYVFWVWLQRCFWVLLIWGFRSSRMWR
jgi:hypothetical protein